MTSSHRKPKPMNCEPIALIASIGVHGSLGTFQRMLARRPRRDVDFTAQLLRCMARAAEEEVERRKPRLRVVDGGVP